MKRTIVAWMLVASSIIVPNSNQIVESEKELMYNSNINNIKYISNMNKLENMFNTKNTNIYNNKVNKPTRASRSVRSFTFRMKNLAQAVAHVESRGNYKAKSRWSSACGAYQYIKSTWNNFGGYSTACKAPKHVQDSRMHKEIMVNFKRYNGDWEKIIAHHFYPRWAGDKSKWNKRVPGNNLTLREYVNKVKKRAVFI